MSRVPWRRIVIEELQLLSSEADQIDYEVSVPHVNITGELLSGWFDDTYHPEADDFTNSFTPAELLALAQFSKQYEEHSRSLPPSQGTVKSWHASPHWQVVMSGARVALSVLVPSSQAGP